MSRLPTTGSDANNWGTLLNDYLQQSLASDGTLVTTAVNSYTSAANTNLATTSRPGLVQLASDLAGTAALPRVAGLQGRTVATAAPSDTQVLTWSAGASQWQPAAAPGSTVTFVNLDGGNASSAFGGAATIDGGTA